MRGLASEPSLTTIINALKKAPELMAALTVGGLVVGIPLAIVGYYLSYAAVMSYQKNLKAKVERQKERLRLKKEVLKEKVNIQKEHIRLKKESIKAKRDKRKKARKKKKASRFLSPICLHHSAMKAHHDTSRKSCQNRIANAGSPIH